MAFWEGGGLWIHISTIVETSNSLCDVYLQRGLQDQSRPSQSQPCISDGAGLRRIQDGRWAAYNHMLPLIGCMSVRLCAEVVFLTSVGTASPKWNIRKFQLTGPTRLLQRLLVANSCAHRSNTKQRRLNCFFFFFFKYREKRSQFSQNSC